MTLTGCPGRCNTAWSLNYHKIMVRFESTISAMFTGHSHDDEFELFYRDNTRTEAAVVNYIGPAVTPYTDANPGIRVYEVFSRQRQGAQGGTASDVVPRRRYLRMVR